MWDWMVTVPCQYLPLCILGILLSFRILKSEPGSVCRNYDHSLELLVIWAAHSTHHKKTLLPVHLNHMLEVVMGALVAHRHQQVVISWHCSAWHFLKPFKVGVDKNGMMQFFNNQELCALNIFNKMFCSSIFRNTTVQDICYSSTVPPWQFTWSKLSPSPLDYGDRWEELKHELRRSWRIFLMKNWHYKMGYGGATCIINYKDFATEFTNWPL